MKTNAWLAVGILVFAGFFLWLLFFSNRYQSLCQIHFWEATSSQISSCNEVKSELDNKQ